MVPACMTSVRRGTRYCACSGKVNLGTILPSPAFPTAANPLGPAEGCRGVVGDARWASAFVRSLQYEYRYYKHGSAFSSRLVLRGRGAAGLPGLRIQLPRLLHHIVTVLTPEQQQLPGLKPNLVQSWNFCPRHNRTSTPPYTICGGFTCRSPLYLWL
jgi:hypothetical protein